MEALMSEAYKLNEDQLFTYADYKEWELKPGERYELIYGVAYAMSAPNFIHQNILALLTSRFFNYLEGKKCRVLPAPFDVRLFYEEDESDNTVVQPDLTVICDPKKIGMEGCRGAPDMVVEILSPSNTAIEMERKLTLYKEAQVREYWIVDPINEQISIYQLEEGEYILRTYYSKDIARPGILPGLEINLAEVFAEPEPSGTGT
jgi:Uma2 family endonuclease